MANSAITGPILSDVRRSPSGSAAAPSWSFAESTGTGVYLVSAGVLGLSTNGAQRVVVDAAGNVGIGTASPADKIDIVGGIKIGGGSNDAIYTTDRDFYIKTNGANNLIFRTANTERMRIDSSGKVQLNTGASGLNFTTSTSLNGTIQFCNSGSVTANPTVLGISNNSIGLQLASATNNANTSGDMMFNIREIDGTDFSTTTSTAFIWKRFSTDLGACSRAGVWSKPGGGSWASLSDERLKHSIQDLGPGLPMITALRPVSFEWKDENVNPLQSKKGFIAQEVEKVNPNWVQESAREEITVDGKVEEILNVKQVQFDTEFTAVLVKAIQELKAELDEAKAKIAALEAK